MHTVNKTELIESKAGERMLVTEILNHLGYLLVAESPIKNKIQQAADKYRGQLLASMTTERQKPFLETRKIVVELARQLATCEDRAMLGRTLSYLQALSQGEVLTVQEPADEATKQRVADYLQQQFQIEASPHQLTDLINLSHDLAKQ